MMKAVSVIAFLLAAFPQGIAQRSEFYKQVRAVLMKEDQLSPVSAYAVGNQTVDPLGFDGGDLQLAVLAYLEKHSKNKLFRLQQSHHLTRISEIANQTFRKAYVENQESFRKLIRKSQHGTLSKFGLIDVYCFEIPLIQARAGQFYFDRKASPGALNLYYNADKKARKGEEAEEPKPVLLFTEAEIWLAIQEKIKRERIYEQLRNGSYYAAGVSMQVNRKTLYRKAVPTVRVVITMGSKRLHLVQKRIEKSKRNKRQLPVNEMPDK